jgi:hypothetical protein
VVERNLGATNHPGPGARAGPTTQQPDPLDPRPRPHLATPVPSPTWLLPLRGTVDLLGTSTLPNAGRVAGTSEIAVFDYRVSGLGIAVLCLRPDPVPTDPGQIGFPPGTPPDYVVTLIVGVPQLALP